MFSKIFSSVSLANEFSSLLLKRISNPLQTSRIINLTLDIQKILNNPDSKADVISKIMNLLVSFKKEHPKDFDEIWIVLKELLENYEKNPDDINKNLKEIFK